RDRRAPAGPHVTAESGGRPAAGRADTHRVQRAGPQHGQRLCRVSPPPIDLGHSRHRRGHGGTRPSRRRRARPPPAGRHRPASLTFATAAVLERHFGYRFSWPVFAIAGYVSASRLTDHRHFLSDVLFGSALGMASGWTVVGRHGRKSFTLAPAPMHGGIALSG